MKLDYSKIEIPVMLKYRALCFSAAIMHLAFLITFLVMEIYMLMVFNIFSVSFYLIGTYLCARKKGFTHILALTTCIYIEIAVHGVLTTICLGTETCFYLYIITTLPVVIYSIFLSCKSKTFVRLALFYTVTAIATLIFSLTYVQNCGNIYDTAFHRSFSDGQIRFMMYMNTVFSFILCFAFFMLFYIEVNTLLGKLGKSNEQLNYIANHDALTGLYNRYYLRGHYDILNNSSDSFCIAMGDLDDFKKVNDTYGHDCGDLVLKTVADIIKRNAGKTDIICRWGGEEILIILMGQRDECYNRVSRMRKEIESSPVKHGDDNVKISMTFGFVCREEKNGGEIMPATGPKGIDTLISTADQRLYVGKGSGKNIIIS